MARRSKLTCLLLALIILAGSLSSCGKAAGEVVALPVSPAPAHPKAGQSFEDRLAAHVAYLASSECEGRLAGTEGDKRAAAYIVDELKSIGIDPLWKRAYLQEFPISLAETDCALELLDAGGAVERPFKYFSEFCETMYPEWGKNVAEGKIAVVVQGSSESIPRGSIAVSRVHSHEVERSIYAAAYAGCAGVLLCDADASADSVPVKYMSRAPRDIPFPVFRIHPRVYEELALKEGSTVRLTVNSKKSPLTRAWNVAGVVGDPARQPTVVLCAHRDHMGMLDDGTVFPGGIDNASSVAVLLEVARQVKAEKLEVAVVFLFVDAEEVGLDGSRYFASHLPFPKENFSVAINLDCVGVPGDDTMEMNAGGGGDGREVADLLISALAEEGIPAKVVSEELGSDHLSFEMVDLPAAGLLAAIDSFKPYLHNHRDTADAVDPVELAAIARAVFSVIEEGGWR